VARVQGARATWPLMQAHAAEIVGPGWALVGDEALLRRYARARLWPTRAMAGAVDGLWQLFSAPAPGVRELRNHAMTLVNHLSPLKRFLVARALGS